jgi:transcriptional regulator with XRE-family HTH domain
MSDEVDIMVGRRLRRRRRHLGLTQQDIARACEVSFQQIQKYESAQTRLSVAMLWQLACVLEVDIGYFFVDLPRTLPADDDRRRRGGKARSGEASDPLDRKRADAA